MGTLVTNNQIFHAARTVDHASTIPPANSIAKEFQSIELSLSRNGTAQIPGNTLRAPSIVLAGKEWKTGQKSANFLWHAEYTLELDPADDPGTCYIPVSMEKESGGPQSAGVSVDEAAAAPGVSTGAAIRDWSLPKAWLAGAMRLGTGE